MAKFICMQSQNTANYAGALQPGKMEKNLRLPRQCSVRARIWSRAITEWVTAYFYIDHDGFIHQYTSQDTWRSVSPCMHVCKEAVKHYRQALHFVIRIAARARVVFGAELSCMRAETLAVKLLYDDFVAGCNASFIIVATWRRHCSYTWLATCIVLLYLASF